MTEQEKTFIAREFDKLENRLDSNYALYENGYQSALFDALEVVNKLPIHNVSTSGYVCHIGKERVFIIAENIAQAMDKMEEIAGNSVFGYSMESHSSIRVIHC